MTNSEIQANLIMEIIGGKITFDDVKKKTQEYETKYGPNFFADYDIEKKDKPWDSAYLNELKIKSMTGMTSKQFILHLAEVSEYVHKYEKNKKKKKCIIIAVVAGIIIIFLILLVLWLTKENSQPDNISKLECNGIESKATVNYICKNVRGVNNGNCYKS